VTFEATSSKEYGFNPFSLFEMSTLEDRITIHEEAQTSGYKEELRLITITNNQA
jgi:hypothetical protein